MLIVFHEGKNTICIISVVQIKRKCVMTHCAEKRSVSNRSKSNLHSVHFFYISICLIRLRAVTVNGRISRHGPSVGEQAVSLSINDIICPADVFLPVTLMALIVEEERNVFFFPIKGLSGVSVHHRRKTIQ